MPEPDPEGGAAARDFWAYSLAVYGRPGVSEAMIRLQDRYGADVNILLLCCWRAETGRPAPDTAGLRTLVESVAPWRKRVVEPLRALRRDMKGGIAGAPTAAAEALRGEVRRAELEAERLEQAMLAAQSPIPNGAAADSRASARRGLSTYLDLLGVARNESVESALSAILDGCVGNPNTQ